ncbi:MAG: iron ABC transporter permease [Coriobacteriales bacterium]|nr:iron ABC transporter permease [Coriobacteriales bacterium]
MNKSKKEQAIALVGQSSAKRYRGVITVLIVIMIAFALIALSIGHYSYNPLDVLKALGSVITGSEPEDAGMVMVVMNIRLPRLIAALFVGGALSLAGSAYQGVFRNPLVSPDLLGVSSGATVGAAIAILLGLGMLAQQGMAFAVGLLAVFISISIPKLVRNNSNLMLVLAGIITSGFMASLCSTLKFIADEDTELSAIVFWQMGSLTTAKSADLWMILPFIVVCSVVLIALSWRLNILSFGEVEAQSLGMNVKRLRFVIIVCASCLTAATICVSGTVSWVGLVIPHLARLLVGSDHRFQMPTAFVLGATFMLFIDTLSRTITTVDIPLSILTGLIGAPFYAWLLYKQRASNIL